jgi:hypothetical protein
MKQTSHLDPVSGESHLENGVRFLVAKARRRTLLRKFNSPLLLRRRRDRHNARYEDDAGGH